MAEMTDAEKVAYYKRANEAQAHATIYALESMLAAMGITEEKLLAATVLKFSVYLAAKRAELMGEEVDRMVRLADVLASRMGERILAEDEAHDAMLADIDQADTDD